MGGVESRYFPTNSRMGDVLEVDRGDLSNCKEPQRSDGITSMQCSARLRYQVLEAKELWFEALNHIRANVGDVLLSLGVCLRLASVIKVEHQAMRPYWDGHPPLDTPDETTNIVFEIFEGVKRGEGIVFRLMPKGCVPREARPKRTPRSAVVPFATCCVSWNSQKP